MDLEVGTVIGGEFTIAGRKVAGATSALFEAEHRKTGRACALRVLEREVLDSPDVRLRFDLEAHVVSALEDEHVVRVLGAGVDTNVGCPFIATEIPEGETLASLLARRRVPASKAREILSQLFQGVSAAHAKGVVHGGLQPESVLLVRGGPGGFTVKVMDFGLAQLFTGEIDLATMSAISASEASNRKRPWMAPEQTQPNATVGPLTDVWALGLIAFRVLTGGSYWREAADGVGAASSLVREMLIDPLVPASLRAAELGARLPLSFDRWFSRCVRREPGERFANADEAHAELTRVLEGRDETDADGEKDATPARGTRSLYKASPPKPTLPASSLPPAMALDAPQRRRPAWVLPVFGGLGVASVIALVVGLATHSSKNSAHATSSEADDTPSHATSAHEPEAAAPSGEWVTDPKSDPRAKTVLLTVTPPPKLVETFRTLSARVDNPRLKHLFGGFALGGSGSGFVLVKRHEPEPLVFVVTNRHVISESESVEITLEDGTKVGGEVLYADYRHDVAVVGFTGKKPPVSTGLSLAPDAVHDLDTVVATGYPFLAGKPSFQISKGEVRNHAFERSFDDDLKETYIQHSASIDPGSSGGPLLDTKNQVVGVNTGFLPEKHDVFLALPSSAVSDAIAQATEIESMRGYENLRTPGIYKACKELAAELASPKPRFSIFLQFISNRFIATDGFSSYLALGNDLGVGSSISTLFDSDPMDGMRDALLVRLYAGVEEGGGVAQNPCGELNPTDTADLTNTPVIRMAFNLKDGQSEIGWTFEHGHWRVASGPLPGTASDMKRHHR